VTLPATDTAVAPSISVAARMSGLIEEVVMVRGLKVGDAALWNADCMPAIMCDASTRRYGS
jgi:hypothetical protein